MKRSKNSEVAIEGNGNGHHSSKNGEPLGGLSLDGSGERYSDAEGAWVVQR